MFPAAFWFSGLILMACEWQLEIIRIRASRGEKFSLPFYVTTDRDHRIWSVVFLMGMAISYLLLVVATGAATPYLSFVVFILGFWQLSRVQFETIRGKAYKPPLILELASEEIEMDLGIKKLVRGKHVSFWGDVWLFMIFLSYVALFF